MSGNKRRARGHFTPVALRQALIYVPYTSNVRVFKSVIFIDLFVNLILMFFTISTLIP